MILFPISSNASASIPTSSSVLDRARFHYVIEFKSKLYTLLASYIIPKITNVDSIRYASVVKLDLIACRVLSLFFNLPDIVVYLLNRFC